MDKISSPSGSTTLPDDRAVQDARQRGGRIELLLGRLPEPLCRSARWLLEPSRRWVRIPAGIAFMLGGCLAILPVFGLWMLPLGLILLSEDFAPLRRLSDRMLGWIERRHPGWMGLSHKAG